MLKKGSWDVFIGIFAINFNFDELNSGIKMFLNLASFIKLVEN